MLRVFWATSILAIMSAGFLNVGSSGGSISYQNEAVAQMLANGGPFP